MVTETPDTSLREIIKQIEQGDMRALARAISIIENESKGYEELLEGMHSTNNIPVIGITGPPGAGKSTLINALAKYIAEKNKSVAILAVDPSSPFNKGALMGDRVRMSEHFTDPNIFIRSMASRGSLGGLAPKVFEVTDVLKAAKFDYIIIETVGVGQSEVEIAALADTTILVLVPEAGDEIQTLKSGIMEIADIYVLNKADREGAEMFHKNLLMLAHGHIRNEWEAPVIKTVALKGEGVPELYNALLKHASHPRANEERTKLLAEKVMLKVRELRSSDIKMDELELELRSLSKDPQFNLYRYIKTLV